jgi:hypothetical protein
MFKELILAIIFGGLIGFGATGTFIALKNKNTPIVNNSTTEITVTPIISQTEISPTISSSNTTLNIFQPQTESVVTDSKLILKGQTDNSAIVVITTTDNSYSTTADSSGNFDTIINLNPGINHLKVTSISPTEIQQDTEIFITYTTAKI